MMQSLRSTQKHTTKAYKDRYTGGTHRQSIVCILVAYYKKKCNKGIDKMLSMCYNTDTKREEHNTYTKGDNHYV